MQTVDYIIVGQGIAGSNLGMFLDERGQKLAFINQERPNTSTKIAAGLINPITGRRYVKTWMADILIPFAVNYYHKLEEQFKATFVKKKRVAWQFTSPNMENNWMARSSGENQAYIAHPHNYSLSIYQDHYHDVRSVAEVKNAGRIDMVTVIKHLKTYFQEHHIYLEEAFDYSEINYQEDQVIYNGITAKGIIFCEGALARFNPYFEHLPFNLAKGEILIVKIPNYQLYASLIKHSGLFIVPWDEEKQWFWVGSSYNRDFKHEAPTPEEKATLIDRLKACLQLPFEVVDHIAGIRPTVRDRRPFLGRHKEHKQLFIFNGMGAKGSYLSPYFAEHFTSYLLDGTPLLKEADIKRLGK